MKIELMIQMFLEHVKMYRTQGTYLYYKKMFKSLIIAMHKNGYFEREDIDDKIIFNLQRYYLDYTQKKHSKINDTISSMVSLLKYFKIDVMEYQKLKDDTKNFTSLTQDDLISLMNYCKTLDLDDSNNIYWVLSIYLFLETGIRLSELLDIKIFNIDTKLKMIHLDHTKNGYQRIVFYGDFSFSLINRLKKKKQEYLFEGINMRSLQYFFKKMNKRLKLRESICPHRLRKTFATSLLRHGCPLTTISKLLGHRDIRQTMIYLDIDEVQLKKDYEQYYPFRES